MKTVVCDICGKNKEQIDFDNRTIHHFKRTVTWGQITSQPKEIDICSKCMKALQEAMKKGGVSDEKSKG